MAVLQFQHRLPLVQPVGFPLALLRPDIAEVDGVAYQLTGGIVLAGDIRQLGQTAVHLQHDALLERLRLERVQSQQQLVRVSGVHVLPGIREAHPYAVHVVSAGQLHPDGVLPGHWLEKLGLLRPGNREGGSPQIEDSLVPFPVDCAHLCRMEEGCGLRCGALQIFQDEPAQGLVVPGPVVEIKAGELVGQLHGTVSTFRMLQFQRAGEQKPLFFCHIGKPPLQPLAL